MEDLEFNSDFLRGHINTIILKSLLTSDKYGLEICKEIEKTSEGSFVLKQPSLYSALKRLETLGLISSYWKDSDIGGKRHYYAITKEGISTFNTNQDEWAFSRKMIDSLISKPAPVVADTNQLGSEATAIKESIDSTILDIKNNLKTTTPLSTENNNVKTDIIQGNNQWNFFSSNSTDITEDLDAFKQSVSSFYSSNIKAQETVVKPVENETADNEQPLYEDTAKESDAMLLKDPDELISNQSSTSEDDTIKQTNSNCNDGKLLASSERILTDNELKKLKEEQAKFELEELEKQKKAEFFETSQTKDDALLITENFVPKTEKEQNGILNNIYLKSSSEKDNNLNDLVDKKDNKTKPDTIAKNIFDSNLEEVSGLNTKKQYVITSYAKSKGAPAFSKSFIKYNYYSLLKNFILLAFAILELGISYLIFNKFRITSTKINITFLVCLIISILPLFFSIIFAIISPQKKKNSEHLKHNVIVELIVIVILLAILYSICRLLGIADIFKIENLPFIILPSLVILNILTNHLLSFLIKKINALYA